MEWQSAVRYLFILQKEGEREGGTNRQILTQIEREGGPNRQIPSQIERERMVQIDKYLHR